MASCVCEMNRGKTLLRCFPPAENMIRAADDGEGSERDCRKASSPSSCSSRGSSWSSASLERRVNREADKDRILDKVRVLQQEAVSLQSEISGGRVDADHVKLALEMMLQEHSVLGDIVSTAALALETFNRRSGGHAASTIATYQASLREELKVLAEHLSALEEVFRSGCGLLWSSELRPPPTGDSCSSNNDRVLPIVHSSGSPAKIDENDSSPRLPDIYLTPSHPVYSSTSHQSPTSESISSIPHSSPPSSLPNLDPFTPDTISAPPTRDNSGVHSGVPATYSGVPTAITPVSQPTHKSPQTMLVGGDCGRSSSSTTVLQWLMSSDHQTAESEEEEEEGIDGGGWRRDGFSPAGSESVETGTAVSTLSPPISSPLADSGIASLHYSSHLPPSSLPPPSSRLSSPLPLSVTMSDIEAMKAELAKLREEIRNTSNWSPSLCQEYSAPSSTSLPPPPTFSISNSQPGQARASAGFKERFTATTSSLDAATLDSTPAVPRPFHSLSKSHSRVSRTPLSSSSSLSGHRRLFSSPHTPLHSDQQRTLTKSHRHQSVQTMPVTTPNTHSSTKSWNRTEPIYHHLHSRLPFTTHPSDPLPSYSPHTLPPNLPHNFTPHFVVRASHHPPSFSSTPLSHLPSHTHLHSSSIGVGGQNNTYTTSHLSPWLNQKLPSM